MEFLRLVEDDLRALSVEARKKHPVVKEAAERGIVRLRALREQYAAAVRESGESPPTSMLRSQDLLRPFLLACNHSDCSRAMILQALSGVQRLINRNAISPSDAPNILRVLAIQATAANTTQDLQVKVLQTLLLTVTWRSCELPEDTLASALAVCIQLAEQRNATVKNAASATLRQVISLIFDRVGCVEGDEDDEAPSSPRGGREDEEDEEGLEWSHTTSMSRGGESGGRAAQRGEPEGLRYLRPVERCAYYLIQDLCLLSRGEAGTWLKHVTVPQTVGVELIEQVLVHKAPLFRERQLFTDVVRNQVCPLVVQTLKSGLDFALLVRLMRTISTVVGELADLLVPQCEVILTMLTQLLSSCDLSAASSTSSAFQSATEQVGLGAFTSQSRASKLGLWSVMLSLDVMSSVCQDGQLLHTLFRNYDLLPDCTNIFANMVKALTRFVIEASTPVTASLSMHAAANAVSWSSKGLPNLSRGFELLKETSPPAISEGEVLLNAVGCLLAMLDSLARLTIEAQLQGSLRSPVPSRAIWQPGLSAEGDCPGYLYHRMLVKGEVWRDIQQCFTHIFTQSAGSDQLYDACLLGFERFVTAVHLLGVTAARSQTLGLLCKLAVPAVSLEAATSITQPSSLSSSSGGINTATTTSAAVTTPGLFTTRHLRATRSLLRLVGLLGNALGDNWETVIESLDLLDASVGRSSAIVGPTTPADGSLDELRMALRRFSTFTATLEDPSLSHLTRACASYAEALLTAEQAGGRATFSDGSDALAPTTTAATGPSALPGAAGSGSVAGPSSSSTTTPSTAPTTAREAELGPSRHVTSAAFVLRLLVRSAYFNVYRVEVVWAAVQDHLSFVACCRSPALRAFGVGALADLVIKALVRSDGHVGVRERVDSSVGYNASSGEVPGAVLGCLPDLDAVFNVQGELDRLPGRRSSTTTRPPPESSQLELLRPLQELGSAAHLDTREQALLAFFRVLQSAGHVLDAGWPCVFDLLRSVAGAGSSAAPEAVLDLTLDHSSGKEAGKEGDEGEEAEGQLLGARWGASCLPQAFQSLKLIIDEHLDSVPKRHLADCIGCMGSFASQLVDVNISLTSMGMVWTVADFVSTQKGLWGPEEEAVWDAIFAQMGKLWVDARPEVRNCAINTLFSCVVGHGISFPMVSWRARIDAILALIQAVEDKARSSTGDSSSGPPSSSGSGRKGAMKVVIHHSRDTASKQWSETRVLAMQGMGRLHRAFLRHLRQQTWYEAVWTRTLQAAKLAILHDGGNNTEVALAAISLLFTLLQLASRSGLAHGPLRAAVGMKVVDGALQQANEVVSTPPQGVMARSTEGRRGTGDSEAFEASKVALWEEAWAAVQASSKYTDDEEGEVASAFATHLQATYDCSRAWELSSLPRMLEFLSLVEGTVETRRPKTSIVTTEAAGNNNSTTRRSAWRPPVLNCQREALTLLRQIRSDEAEVWRVIFHLLTRFAARQPQQEQGEESASPSGGFVRMPVSKQFCKEAAECLAQLYAQSHVLSSAKAMAFDTVITALGGGCLQCATLRRGVSRAQWSEALGHFAAREAGGAVFVLSHDMSALVEAGGMLSPILRHGLASVRECGGDGPAIAERWAQAMLVVEGYLMPWRLEAEDSVSSSSSGSESSSRVGEEVGGGEYVSVAIGLMQAMVDASLGALEGALRCRVTDCVADALVDALLAHSGVATACRLDSDVPPNLDLHVAIAGHIKSMLQALLTRASESGSRDAIAPTRHLVRRVLHAATWILQRYLSESRVTDAPSRAYVVAEAHALLMLDLIKALRLPAWALPPPSQPDSFEEEDAAWAVPSLLPTRGGGKGREEVLESLRVGSSTLFAGHVLLLCPVMLDCLATGSSAVRSSLAEVMQAARVSETFNALRVEVHSQRVALGELQHELGRLRQEGVRRTASGGFF